MKQKKDLYEECEVLICYDELFDSFDADLEEIVFIQSHGNGVIVRDFWSYFYKIKHITLNEMLFHVKGGADTFMLVGKNVLVSMKYIDTLTSKYVQAGGHLIPIDSNIKQNLANYQRLVFDTKENYDKICDRSGEFADDERNRWGGGTDSLFTD
tara:strand:- start:6529 stop:6990 length:462 start_codon:yes stop_codon:yes gene_type:complete